MSPRGVPVLAQALRDPNHDLHQPYSIFQSPADRRRVANTIARDLGFPDRLALRAAVQRELSTAPTVVAPADTGSGGQSITVHPDGKEELPA